MTVPAADKRFCVAQVSEEAIDGWRAFCDRNHVDRTALCEVIGAWMLDPTSVPSLVERWLLEARDLKNQRRRRG